MSIIKKDEFCFFENQKKPLSIIFDNRVEEIVRYVNDNAIHSLTVQPMLHDVITDEAI